MQKILALSAVFLLILSTSCNVKVNTNLAKTYPPIDYREKIQVIDLNDPIPNYAEQLGEVEIGDTGFTSKCHYQLVLEKAKMEARKAGGNAIKINKHRLPSAMGSTCHRISVLILKVKTQTVDDFGKNFNLN